MTEKQKELAEQIGLFYLAKNGGDYIKTREEIERLGIKDILPVKDIAIIWTTRPGLLIGKRGKNILALEYFIHYKIHIIEEMDDILDYLIPIELEDLE